MRISKQNQSVLIVGPDLSLEGGVANIYRTLKWQPDDRVEYFAVTPAKVNNNIFFICGMLFRYVRGVRNVKIVQINPSLDFRSVVRDGILLLIAKAMRRKVIVFFHGWDDTFADKLKDVHLAGRAFAYAFSKSDAICVLSPLFTQKLRSLGVCVKRVFQLPTVADNSYILKKGLKRKPASVIHILFLSRLDENKGVSIATSAFELLEKRLPGRFRLTLAGNGPLFKSYAGKPLESKNSSITLTGFVDGELKHSLLEAADVLILPSRSEGLPCAILEGMLYGLAIISRPIGGIPDWVKQPENGWLLDSFDPNDYADVLESISEKPELLVKISENNIALAKKYFTPDRVRQQMMMIHKAVL